MPNQQLTRAILLILASTSFVGSTVALHNGSRAELKKACAEGCEKLGNCNHETGQCECPLGYRGPKCEENYLSACYIRPGGPAYGDVPSLGVKIPKACACYDQIRNWTCTADPFSPAGSPGSGEQVCIHPTTLFWLDIHCFEKQGVPWEQQNSVLPLPNDTSYKWYKGCCAKDGRVVDYSWQPADPPHELSYGGDIFYRVRQPDECSDRCNYNGWCHFGPGQPFGRCTCLSGYTGHNCSTVDLSVCVSNCTGRGTCIGGFCHCQPGFWGIGCGRSRAFAAPPQGAPVIPFRGRPRIYMYDVPSEMVFPYAYNDGGSHVFIHYSAFLLFMSRLLGDSGVRTEDPAEANLFYVPSFTYYLHSNLGDPSAHLLRIVRYIKAQYPWFSRHQGKDHFVWLTSDRGACYLRDLPELQNMIKVVHFGLSEPNIKWMKGVHNMEVGCFLESRDVVAAGVLADKEVAHAAVVYEHMHKEYHRWSARRTTLFYFSGGVRHDQPDYSGGARQELSKVIAELNRTVGLPDVGYDDGTRSMHHYIQELQRSKFCMAPYGHGWGIRLQHAILHGCVPVIIQDHVHQPYEDVLPYEDFSIRVAKRELPHLIDILRAVSPEELHRLRRGMSKYYTSFIWQKEHGGQAYELTLQSLHRSMFRRWGELYKRAA